MRVGFVVIPGYSVMGFAVATVFEVANLVAGKPTYDVRFVSEKGGAIRTSVGVSVHTQALDNTHFDTLMVEGASDVRPSSEGIRHFLRKAARRTRRIASICVGAFVLAEAGLLARKKATTHWLYASELQTRFPDIKVDADRIFTKDGAIWTSAGMTAGLDLGLALVEDDLGADVARATAKKLVMYHRRAGGQSQFSVLLELAPKSDRIQQTLTYAQQHLNARLSIEDLAQAASLSPRQFSRIFRAETGQSPAKAIENLRVEAARLMMEQGRHSIDTVARQTGFADRDRMRRAFLRTFGQPPQVLRRNARR
ncbi:MAG: GlxA family transcriptional regulator [Gammaproteobacteria bacterium]|nr:GlxA family transcriptional regulator [Gammaproteobacteria bacterium]